MSESRISLEEMGVLHDEALAIDDEVEKRKNLYVDDNTSLSGLARSSIELRANRLPFELNKRPEIRDKVLKYRAEILPNGTEIYVDPIILAESDNVSKTLLAYLESPEYPSDLENFRKHLPKVYKMAEETPVIYVHSLETARSLDSENTLGFVYRSKGAINIVNHEPNEGNKFTFFHEYCHILEHRNPDLSLFAEGVANMTADKVFGYNTHGIFMKRFLSLQKNQALNVHPIFRITGIGESFHFSLRDLISEQAMIAPDGTSHEERVAHDLTRYDFAASFLLWYQSRYDADLTIINRTLETTPNYFKVFIKLCELFPPRREQSVSQITGENKRIMPKFTQTIPEDLINFGNQLMMISIPESDPLVAELADRISGAEKEEAAELCRDFIKTAEKKLEQVEEEYNAFISSFNTES